MPFITVFDDDPNDGPMGYRTYEVLNINRGGVSLIGDGYVQRMHPNDANRRVHAQIGEPGDVARAHIRRRN